MEPNGKPTKLAGVNPSPTPMDFTVERTVGPDRKPWVFLRIDSITGTQFVFVPFDGAMRLGKLLIEKATGLELPTYGNEVKPR